MEVSVEKLREKYYVAFQQGNQLFALSYHQEDLEDVEWMKSMLEKAFNNFEIEILSKYIGHPTKPGYKRSDIVDRIKQLQK